jgi:hypothetical protein
VGVLGVACASAPASAEQARVELTLVGTAETAAFLEKPLAASIGRTGAHLEVRTTPALEVSSLLRLETSAAIARIWIHALEGDRFWILLSDRSGQRLLVRRVTGGGSRDEVAREEICQIVESAVESLLGGGELGVSRAEAARRLGVPEAPPPPPRAAPAPPTRKIALTRSAGLAIGYHATAWSASHPLHGPFLGIHVRQDHDRFGLGLALTVEPRFAETVPGDVVQLKVSSVGARLVPRLAVHLGRGARLHLGLGGGFDAIDSAPLRVPGSRARPDPAEAYVSAVFRGEFGLDVRPFDRASVSTVVALDVDTTHNVYFLVSDGRRREVFAPFRVHPVIAIALTADVFVSRR